MTFLTQFLITLFVYYVGYGMGRWRERRLHEQAQLEAPKQPLEKLIDSHKDSSS